MKDKIKAAKERLNKVYKDGEEYELKLLKELETELEQELNDRQEKNKTQQAEDRLRKVYEDGEKFELEMLERMRQNLSKGQTLTKEQQQQAVQMGVGLADKMELDMLKLKYKQNLEDNGGIKNKKIEKLIKDLEKKL
jgi:hypothetical protein